MDDAALGFRDGSALWPAAIKSPAGAQLWVLLKMARPIAQGDLWEHLLRYFSERLVVVMTINDLRLSEVQVSRELSWERTSEDLARELVSNPRVNALSQCAHVAVSLNTDGALLLSRRDEPQRRSPGKTRPACQLIFDPKTIEGVWAQQYPGGMVGYTSCLTAGIARELMISPTSPDISRGIRSGLAAMRRLHLIGYGSQEADARADLKFPHEQVVAELARETKSFAVADVPSPKAGSWTILEARYPEGLEQIARQIARCGTALALEGVPLGQFGDLLTVDRAEIEGFRSIRSLIQEYSRGQPTRPLSIAVFGPPGAGKSFGIVEVAKSLPGEFKRLDFNLSQLSQPAELHGALHQVRDVGLAGRMPLVFWDEFDTTLGGTPLGWLRYFLVPMQDGTFQEDQVVHPIGRAIFVFAGGTSHQMTAFEANAMKAVAAKGPDFLSRLKGYVDVLGPNPRHGNAATDPYHVVRRAILLRSLISRDRPNVFEMQQGTKILSIDSGVLRAFLQTREYRHGARSLEAIVAMSLLHGKIHFERSALPAAAQLNVHVNAADFLALAQRHEPEDEALERLAEAAHIVYCAAMLKGGYRWGEPTLEYLHRHSLLRPFVRKARRGTKTHPTLVAYGDLSGEDKEQNRGQVRDIASRLESLGYVMRKAIGGSDPSPLVISGPMLERLAKQEHERWLLGRLLTGWRFGSPRNNRRKIHPALLPWTTLSRQERKRCYGVYADLVGSNELAEGEKQKDREAVREMAQIAAAAGYEIVRVREPGVIVGVTGHRFLIELNKIGDGIVKALERIEQSFPGKPLTVMSALAEGADRLVAKPVLARSTGGLTAVLPLAATDYQTDFESAESTREFLDLLAQADEVIELPPARTREAAYEAVGDYIVEHCDVLVPVWDGKGAQGRGGTGAVVARARERGLPIAWVHAGNRKPTTNEPTSLGAEQGMVTFERLEPS